MANKTNWTGALASKPARLTRFLPQTNGRVSSIAPRARMLIGVLEGTGIGPEVVGAALQTLESVGEVFGLHFEIRRGGLIGDAALARHGQSLPQEVVRFCAAIFAESGAVLSGPGGGRYVYDLRRQFDLFCKFVPVKPWPELARAGRISPSHLADVDLLIVRENVGGVYQGEWNSRATPQGRLAEHSFGYAESQVRRLVEVGARAAAARRGQLHVILKDGGVPAISDLWREVGLAVGRELGVETAFMNVDLAAYELIQNPARFDVIVAPNLFGDILADVSGALLGSRGVTFSGNYDPEGRAVYQTNHGCAHDLAGRDVANPAGQMLSLAMLLRESFGLDDAANHIERALADVWRAGWRTADLAEPGCRVVGTREMADRVADQLFRAPAQSVLATVEPRLLSASASLLTMLPCVS